VRSYDVTTYFWITESGLTAGTDYTVHTESGERLTPNAQGAYSLTWPKAQKGVQGVKIRRLTSATGTLHLNVLDRSRFTSATYDRDNLETLINNETNDYLVRGLYFDWNTQIVRFQ
jgi:hypothetical protein